MVAAGLRALLEQGAGVGEFPDAPTGYAEHPVCGDRMELSVRREGDLVRAVRWRASGCPASMALAALCAEVLVDVRVDAVEQVLREGVAARGGLERHEQHAERMALRALREATAS
ncbi:MAG: iron-sulfur cluster assembly scaffold protein [Planctomycetota bacterium]